MASRHAALPARAIPGHLECIPNLPLPPEAVANLFASGAIDRCGERRRDPVWIAERLADPATRVIPMCHARPLVCITASGNDGEGGEGAGIRPVFMSGQSLHNLDASLDAPVFLGVTNAIAYFTVDLDDEQARAVIGSSRCAGEMPATFADLRGAAAQLSTLDGALLAYARAILWWDERNRFCAVCGSPTERQDAGHVRICTSCNTSHFPRTDAAVIVLVTHGDACLLGNHAASPPERYSTLAGFVEPGESLEDAVRREVREEAGVELTVVRYHSSQPWPFPASLMVGFTAEAADRTIHVDSDELRSAHWFTREELGAAVDDGTVRLSPTISIARRLIDEWRSAGVEAG